MTRDLRAAIRNQPAVEPHYDWDAIFMPGTIQPYGALVVADPASRLIQFVSQNIAELFHASPSALLGQSFLTLAGTDAQRTLLDRSVGPDTILFDNPVRLTFNGVAADAVLHTQGGLLLIEIEPRDAHDSSGKALFDHATRRIGRTATVDLLYQQATDCVRELSGFDRVVLYRFDPHYNGQVLAESRRDGAEPLLGLFFPASDIPARTRQSLLTNTLRYVPDVGAPNARMVGLSAGGGRAGTAQAIDMGRSNLRAVASCHIQYLRDMGVQASMSISIGTNGQMWGLFACHNFTPRPVGYDRRMACSQVGLMFAHQLQSLSSAMARQARRRAVKQALGGGIRVGSSLASRIAAIQAPPHGGNGKLGEAIEALRAEIDSLLPLDPAQLPAAAPPAMAQPGAPAQHSAPAQHGSPAQHGTDTPGAAVTQPGRLLLDLVDADSAAILRHGRIRRIGDAPSEATVSTICAMFRRELPDLLSGEFSIFATDSIATAMPGEKDMPPNAAGVLAGALSLTSPAYLLWFRRAGLRGAAGGGRAPDPDAPARPVSLSWMIDDIQVAEDLTRLMRLADHDDPAPARPPHH